MYRVLIVADMTLARPAPRMVPAAPKREPTTAMVIAVRAPPPICGRLNSFFFSGVDFFGGGVARLLGLLLGDL
ncbi:MAG: hypothetical protein R2719_07990 [Micropruina sp.]